MSGRGRPAAHLRTLRLSVHLLKDGEVFDEEAVKKELSAKLAKYKIPSYFLVYNEFPLLGTGKIDAVSLKKDALEKIISIFKR